MNERTNCVSAWDFVFWVEDDETERDRQLIGYSMIHSIQVRFGCVRTKINIRISN